MLKVPLLCGALAAADPAHAAELDADELQALLAGNTVASEDRPYRGRIFFAADGSAWGTGPNGSRTGTWNVRRRELCVEWQSGRGNFCHRVAKTRWGYVARVDSIGGDRDLADLSVTPGDPEGVVAEVRDATERPLELRFSGLDGRPYDLAARLGQPAVIYVYAAWCRFCGGTLASLQSFHREFGADGVQVVAISVDEIRRDAVDLARSSGVTFPVAWRPAEGHEDSLPEKLRVPTTYLVDHNGRIASTGIGGLPDAQVKKWIRDRISGTTRR